MPTLNTTPNQGYQLPFGGNDLSVDVARIISAISAIDVDIANALAALASKAGLASPVFTGSPTAPTAAPGTDTGQLATTAFVKAALDALIGGAPGALDTLNELAAALADDAEFAATIAAAIALKADSASVVRHDTVQALTIAQQYQARTNISAGFGFENRLINPLYLVDIQGNAGGVTSGQHVVEGWCMAGNTDVAVSTMSRQIGGRVPYCLRYTVTTGSDASIGAAQYLIIQTAIEGYDIADAKWGTVEAKSIWVCGRIKAPTTGVYCLCVRNGLGDRRYVFEVSCVAGTWVDFVKEVPGETTGTWNASNSVGLMIFFVVASGTDFHVAADTWSNSSVIATANQANGLATNGNTYEIEDIRVSVGKPIKTEWRPFSLERTHCERYYESGSNDVIWNGYAASGTSYYTPFVPFKTSKRTFPTITKIDANSGFGANSLGSVLTTGFRVSTTCTVTGNSNLISVPTWSANARMI